MNVEEKDPAFLFYCQAFFEGTRLMFPEERACYLDLLIYQHQNGPIPLDTSRMSLYCTGISNEVVNQVLNQKFNQTVNGWVNDKMVKVVNQRSKSSYSKIAYSSLAGLISSNKDLSEETVKYVKEIFDVNHYQELENKEIKLKVKHWFYQVVNAFVNNIIKDKDKDIIKNNNNRTKKFTPPTAEEVKDYCQERNNNIDSENFIDFYKGKGWMIGKTKMKDWKACVRTWERNSNNSKSQANTEDDNR